MDLTKAQELLRRPRELTREEWLAAYEAVQEHHIRGIAAQLPDADDEEDFAVDD